MTGPITAAAAEPNNRKNIIIKNCAPFTNCISEINNTQIDNAKDIDIVMPIYNLIEYSDNYSKTFGSLYQYYRDEPLLDSTGAIPGFPAYNNNCALFKYKTKIAGGIGNDRTKNVKIRIPLKFLKNIWRTLEMPLINFEINLILTWPARCFIIDAPIDGKEPTFTITDTKLYVPVLTLSTQDNAKLLEHLKLGFKRTINWNKYEPKVAVGQQNRYVVFLINLNFQGVNRLFVLIFQNTGGRTSYTRYYLPLVEIKDYNVAIDGRNFFDQPVRHNFIAYDKIQKVAIGQGEDYTTGWLLDYNYFNNYYKMIAIDLSKQQELDVDPKAIQQINFTANLHRDGNTTICFIIEEVKETILDFSQGTVKVL